MKNFKKLTGLLLTLVMVLAMPLSVSAHTITMSPVEEGKTVHTYEVYQIFTGTIAEVAGEDVLTELKWGKNGTGTVGAEVEDEVIEALEVATESDTAKLAVITQYADLTASEKFDTVESGATLENVPAGYYLIKDIDGAFKNQDDSYTKYIVKVVKDITVTPKSAEPTVDKEVYDNDDGVLVGDNNGWGETADHAINETFQFKLTATLTADEDYAQYPEYKVIFTDEMSKGITFEKIDSIKVDGVSVELGTNGVSTTAVAGTKGEAAWTITFDDLKAISGVNLEDGAVIEVIYSAHLNDEALVNHVSGNTTNKNGVNLKYSNNPNAGGENELGQTPDDYVWVFTYDVNNTKYSDEVDEANVLAGAGFTLYDASGTVVQLYEKDGEFYVYDAANAPKDVKVLTEITSQADGTFNIKGLDVGTYTLKETKVPAGYNKCDDITIVISATHTEDSTGNSATTTLTEATTGMDNDIVNEMGTTLPETGGIGTTMFYVIGAILVVGAAVVMITRKRMNR